ncbi:MAG: hypothetical protein VKL60_20945, partial [Sphaerospermopsis sp.]|nr:hypothetical protein [Sphaerospermopsis sp.]
MSQVIPLIIYHASAPTTTDDISIGVEVNSRCHVGTDTYVCTDNSVGAAIWELTTKSINDVLSVGNDAGGQQIKNLGDATEETDAMNYGQFLRGLAGLTSYFFSSTNSDIATYESMPDLANYTSATEANNGGVVVSTTPTSLGKFATNSGFPNITKIPIGLFSAHV